MGNFLYGGKRPTSITYQGKDVQTLKYNGVTVWEKLLPQQEEFVHIARTDGGDIGNMGSATGGEKYFTPNSQYTVLHACWRKIDRNGATLAIIYRKDLFIKIKKGLPLRIFMQSRVVSSPSDTCFLIKSILENKETKQNIHVDVTGDAWRPNGGSRHSSVGLMLTLNCSREIENHNFNDSTSNHEHLDWTK
jgi:hypothetical protein